MSYSVVVSQRVKDLLEELRRKERSRCRELALLLLRLEKDPRWDGSRRLESAEPKMRTAYEERVWERSGFRMAYRVIGSKHLIEVGIVGQTNC